MPVDAVFLDLPKLTMMPGDGDKLVHNGNPFVPELAALSGYDEETKDGSRFCAVRSHGLRPGAADIAVEIAARHRLPQARVYDSAGQFIGIYGYHEEKKRYQPQKVFLERRLRMEIITGTRDLQIQEPTVVTIGKFNG